MKHLMWWLLYSVRMIILCRTVRKFEEKNLKINIRREKFEEKNLKINIRREKFEEKNLKRKFEEKNLKRQI